MASTSEIRLAIEGCGHGTLNAIYASVAQSCKAKGWNGVDLLIIGGDFQAARNSSDLLCMAVPPKYRNLGDFHEYYSGARRAPYLTVFVGGNHEASNHLRELYYGGWVAPNIYYLGAANVVRLGPLRIAALSGIWKGYDYKKAHFERLPMDQDDIRSIYHVREIDTRKLLQLRTQVDIGISHDWPRGVEWCGNHKTLFRWKKHLEPDAEAGRLGSPAAKYVLDHLKPHYWFSAHLHVKYFANIIHADSNSTENPIPNKENGESSAPLPKNEDEIDLDLDEDVDADAQQPGESGRFSVKNDEEIDVTGEDDSQDAELQNNGVAVADSLKTQLQEEFSGTAPLPDPATTIGNRVTHFLALDKCVPRHDFLQLMEVKPHDSSAVVSRPLAFSYDPEWLAITRVFANDVQKSLLTDLVPSAKGKAHYRTMIDEQESWIDAHVNVPGKLAIPRNFTITAPVQAELKPELANTQPREYVSPQTAQFCELIDIHNPLAASEEEIEARVAATTEANSSFGQKSHFSRGRGDYRGHRRGSSQRGRGNRPRVRGW